MNTGKIEITDLQTKKIICSKEFVPAGMNRYYCPKCGEELIVKNTAVAYTTAVNNFAALNIFYFRRTGGCCDKLDFV